jgi:hypothetical protein
MLNKFSLESINYIKIYLNISIQKYIIFKYLKKQSAKTLVLFGKIFLKMDNLKLNKKIFSSFLFDQSKMK